MFYWIYDLPSWTVAFFFAAIFVTISLAGARPVPVPLVEENGFDLDLAALDAGYKVGQGHAAEFPHRLRRNPSAPQRMVANGRL